MILVVLLRREGPKPHLAWWCLRRFACRILGWSPLWVDVRPPRPLRPLLRGSPPPPPQCGPAALWAYSWKGDGYGHHLVGYKVIDLGLHDEDTLASLDDLRGPGLGGLGNW